MTMFFLKYKTIIPVHLNENRDLLFLFNDIVLETGTGKTKKAAEEDAAHKALAKRSTF